MLSIRPAKKTDIMISLIIVLSAVSLLTVQQPELKSQAILGILTVLLPMRHVPKIPILHILVLLAVIHIPKSTRIQFSDIMKYHIREKLQLVPKQALRLM